jgi:transposase-like protein
MIWSIGWTVLGDRVLLLDEPSFHNEEDAYSFVEARLWPAGPVCPHCRRTGGKVGKLKGKSTRRGTYKCYECRRPFTVKIGTVFQASHLQLHLWLQAILLLSSSKRRITVRQLRETLGVGLKTAWMLNKRIRALIAQGNDGLFAIFGERPVAVTGEIVATLKTVITADLDGEKPAGAQGGGVSSPALDRPKTEPSTRGLALDYRKRRRRRPVRPDPKQQTLF